MPAFADQGNRIELLLIFPMQTHDQQHREGDKQPEQHNHCVDLQFELDQQGIDTEHEENIEVFIEILHRNGMACTHEYMATMLQQRVHWHDKKACQCADQHE